VIEEMLSEAEQQKGKEGKEKGGQVSPSRSR
jgi:hypothetical protein